MEYEPIKLEKRLFTSEEDLSFSPFEVDYKNKLIRIKPGNPLGALTLRAEVNVDEIKKQATVDQVQVGVFFGYSLPIYAADNEELYFRENVPGRWDGKSNITFHVLCCLASAETAGETFKFQLSWEKTSETEVVPVTTHDITDEVIVVDGTQYATYEMSFTLDYDVDTPDNVEAHDLLACRLRRVASTGDEVDGEVIVLDWHTHYVVNKVFRAV